MKQLYIFLTLLLCSTQLRAQADDFPRSWEGHWTGELQQLPAGTGHSIPVSLAIQPLDSVRWTWTLHYEAPGQEPRRYELVKSTAGWNIDEQNGVLLPQQFIGRRMACSFSVEDTWLLCYYWLEKEALHMEIHAVAQQDDTGKKNKTPGVRTHFVSSLQQATLYRK